MKVEEGKTYRATNGEKVGPLLKAKDKPADWFYMKGVIGRWAEDGSPYSDSRPDLGALIVEWSDVFMEVGKFYKTRAGLKVGPVTDVGGSNRNGNRIATIPGGLQNRSSWWTNGRTHLEYTSPEDIVGEWVEPNPEPVREVTRLEVNPGRFGVLDVGPQLNGAVSLAFVGKTHYDATDIQAAIDVLTKIKGALTC